MVVNALLEETNRFGLALGMVVVFVCLFVGSFVCLFIGVNCLGTS